MMVTRHSTPANPFYTHTREKSYTTAALDIQLLNGSNGTEDSYTRAAIQLKQIGKHVHERPKRRYSNMMRATTS